MDDSFLTRLKNNMVSSAVSSAVSLKDKALSFKDTTISYVYGLVGDKSTDAKTNTDETNDVDTFAGTAGTEPVGTIGKIKSALFEEKSPPVADSILKAVIIISIVMLASFAANDMIMYPPAMRLFMFLFVIYSCYNSTIIYACLIALYVVKFGYTMYSKYNKRDLPIEKMLENAIHFLIFKRFAFLPMYPTTRTFIEVPVSPDPNGTTGTPTQTGGDNEEKINTSGNGTSTPVRLTKTKELFSSKAGRYINPFSYFVDIYKDDLIFYMKKHIENLNKSIDEVQTCVSLKSNPEVFMNRIAELYKLHLLDFDKNDTSDLPVCNIEAKNKDNKDNKDELHATFKKGVNHIYSLKGKVNNEIKKSLDASNPSVSVPDEQNLEVVATPNQNPPVVAPNQNPPVVAPNQNPPVVAPNQNPPVVAP
jgi:hypothetical protein